MQSVSAHITAYLCISSILLLEFISCSKKIFFFLYRSADMVKNVYMLLRAIRKPARNHKIFQYNKNKFKEKGGKKERRKQTFPQRIHAVPKMVFYFFICLSSLLPNCLLHTPNPSRMCFTRSSMSTFCSMTCMLGALPRAIYLYFYYILPSIVQKDLPPESHNLISLY